jgi:ATP-binding cassette subfamily B protein
MEMVYMSQIGQDESLALHTQVKNGDLMARVTEDLGKRGAIRFENISFTYGQGNKFNIQDWNLDITPGQHIAIVGASGSGKSTIANLFLRLFDVQQGRITIDGMDIRDYTLSSLRKQISVVLQESVLFAGTVRENICFGIEGCDDEAAENAAKMVNAHDFINWLPEGYDTMLGECAASLSQGQQQRLAIARAAVRQCPILIFDEPDVGLDSLNEKLVLQALLRIAAGRTTIHITHRLQAARYADQIIFVKDGRILESGNHCMLMRQQGEYSSFYDSQTGALAHG